MKKINFRHSKLKLNAAGGAAGSKSNAHDSSKRSSSSSNGSSNTGNNCNGSKRSSNNLEDLPSNNNDQNHLTIDDAPATVDNVDYDTTAITNNNNSNSNSNNNNNNNSSANHNVRHGWCNSMGRRISAKLSHAHSSSKLSLIGINNIHFNEANTVNGEPPASPLLSLSRSKTNSLKNQNLVDYLDSLYCMKDETNNPYFITDNLPAELSSDWINNVLSNDNVNYSSRLERKLATIHEFLSTELNFLNQMQFLLDISNKVMTEAQQSYFKFLNMKDVFLNVGDIYEANYKFWSDHLYPSYKMATDNKEPISCSSWKVGFQQMDSIFFPYQNFCARMTQCQQYIQNLEKENKMFAKFSQWFSNKPAANRESLSDFIAKPFQRLTKYGLLLSTISKYSEDDEEKKDLAEMINNVKQFMTTAEQKITISNFSSRLEPMDFVELPNESMVTDMCTQYRVLDLTQFCNVGGVQFLRDYIGYGNMKLKESQIKNQDVTCLIFSDLILICQKIKNIESDRIRIIRPIIPISKLVVKLVNSGSLLLRVLDDFNVLTAAYVLIGEPDKLQNWINDLSKAQIKLDNMNKSTLSNNVLLPEFPIKNSLQLPSVEVTSASPRDGRSPSPQLHYKGNRSYPPNSRNQLNRFNSYYHSRNIKGSKYRRSLVDNNYSLDMDTPKSVRSFTFENSEPINYSINDGCKVQSSLELSSAPYLLYSKPSMENVNEESFEDDVNQSVDSTFSLKEIGSLTKNHCTSNNSINSLSSSIEVISSSNLLDNRKYQSMMSLTNP